MNTRIIVVIGCGLIVLICLMFYRPRNDEPIKQVKSHITPAQTAENALPESSSPASQPISQPSAADDELALVPRNMSIDSGEITSSSRPEFVWYTQPTSTGTIKNSKGEIIFQATRELPFISMRSRGNVSQVVIISGNRNAFVIDPETKQRVLLPKQPPEEEAKGFENWEWVDNDTLLAEYQVMARGPDGKSVSCCQGHGVAETKLYAYNLKSNALVKVALPKPLEGTAFNIGRIAKDGSFEAVTTSNHLSDGKSVGWFYLNATK